MKKTFIILLLILLSGCSNSSEERTVDITEKNDSEISSVSEIDLTELGIDLTDLEGGTFSGINGNTYENFSDLLDAKYADFYYGEVLKIEENNAMVDSVYFQVIKSNNKTDEIIRISVGKDSNLLMVGSLLVLHLSYVEEYDYYSLSGGIKSVFRIDGERVFCYELFQDEFDDSSKNKKKIIFNIIFD